MQEFRVGLVGLGAVANFHIAALKKVRGVRLVAACDPLATRRDYVRNRWKLGKLYASLDEMRAQEQLDSVHVLTPPPLHVSVGLRCLQQSWHCLIEKPVAIDVKEGELLELPAQQNKRTVGVNHNKIWNPAFRKLSRLAHENALGEIRHVMIEHSVQQPFHEGDWRLGDLSFPILETAAHTFSAIADLLGSIRDMRSRICETMQVGDRSFVTSWQSTLECEKGNAFAFVSLQGAVPRCTVSVSGTKGSAQADLLANTLLHSRHFDRFEPYRCVFKTATDGASLLRQSLIAGMTHAVHRVGYAGFGDPFLESMRQSINEFYQALRENRDPKANLRAGLEAVRSCQMVAASLSGAIFRL